MNRLNEEQIVAIERDISAKAVSEFGLSLRCLLFDATNFFTFIDSFNDSSELSQRGHSKEGRDNLRIVGLALLVSSDGDVPLFHHVYAGNQHDSVTFGSVAEELANRCRHFSQGVSDITLVFDKGNNSAENIVTVGQGPFHFVGSLVPTHHPELLAIPRRRMHRLDRKRLPTVWSYRTRQVVFGVERTVLCTFNQPLFDAQLKTLRREIRTRARKLAKVREAIERCRNRRRGKAPTVPGTVKQVEAILSGRHMKDLFSAKVSAERDGLPRLRFAFSDRAWRNLRTTLLGKTILFTDQDDWSDEEIVLAYRAQYHVEGAFRRMKDPHFLTFRPTFHWTDQKLRVHAFYCVLALTIASLLRRKLSRTGIVLSVAKMMRLLAAIHEIAIVYPATTPAGKPSVCTVLSELDESQRAVFSALDLDRYHANSQNTPK